MELTSEYITKSVTCGGDQHIARPTNGHLPASDVHWLNWLVPSYTAWWQKHTGV